MKTKVLALMFAIVMLLTCIAGCSSGETAVQAPVASDTAAAPAVAATDQKPSTDSDLGAPQTFKFALPVAATNPYALASADFARFVEEKSGGNMKVEMFYDGALGGDPEVLDALQMDSINFGLMGPASFQTLSPMFNFLDLPCLFETTDAAYEFQNGEAVQSLLSSEDLLASGIRGLGFFENGFYLFSSNKAPITKLDDLKNKKIRSMTAPLAIKSWECLQVQPVTMPWGELFVALQNGTVEGQETTVGSFYTSLFYEVQKYITQSNRIFHVMTFLVSETTWERLTPAQQNIIMESIAESAKIHKERMKTYNQETIADMVNNHGVVYTESLEEGEFEKMKELSVPVYEAVEAFNPALYAELIAAVNAANEKYPAK